MQLPPFLSSSPMEGDPPCAWSDFVSPKLRQFPLIYHKIQTTEFLGHGIEGCVARVRFDDGNPQFALKIFFGSAPNEDASPNQDGWWPLEREARTAAVLEKVQAGIRQSSPKPIYVPEKRTTRLDCLRCLYAFSADGRSSRDFDSLPARQKVDISDSFTRIRKCYGWIRVRGADFEALNERIYIDEDAEAEGEGSASYIEPDQNYFAIVYEYVPSAKLEMDAVQRQLNFFYRIGFDLCQGAEERNWQGPGILLDFGDYNSPVDRWYEGAGVYYPCLSAELLVDRAGFLEKERKKEERMEKMHRQRITRTEEEERAEKQRRASSETATRVEWGYQGDRWHVTYFDLDAEGIKKYGLEEDPLAHIRIPDIEPSAMQVAWGAYERQRKGYLEQVVQANGAASESH